jgi:hypothetical protein
VRELKVWAHAVALGGADQALAADAEIRSGDAVTACELGSLGAQAVLPLTAGGWEVNFVF